MIGFLCGFFLAIFFPTSVLYSVYISSFTNLVLSLFVSFLFIFVFLRECRPSFSLMLCLRCSNCVATRSVSLRHLREERTIFEELPSVSVGDEFLDCGAFSVTPWRRSNLSCTL